MRRKLLVLAIGLTGCATAHKDSLTGRPDSGITIGDSNNMIDAPPVTLPDAPVGGSTQTLSQTMANNDTQVGIACGPTAGGYTNRNSYYRVFALSNYGINGTFHVTGIDFIVSAATSSPQLTIGIGTYTGTTGGNTLNAAGINLTQTTTFAPADTTTAVPQHIDIATDVTGNLVVEIDQKTAGSTATPYMFYIGANSAGEMVPGYISTPDCNDPNTNLPYTTPTSMSSLAGSAADMVLTVTGST